MSKFKQEELLEKLNKAFEYLPLSIANGQAHRQIKEMIRAYTEHQELTANYIDIVIDLYDQLERKKPGVTEEFVEKWADKFDGFAQQGLIIDIGLIRQMLKEAGVRVA